MGRVVDHGVHVLGLPSETTIRAKHVAVHLGRRRICCQVSRCQFQLERIKQWKQRSNNQAKAERDDAAASNVVPDRRRHTLVRDRRCDARLGNDEQEKPAKSRSREERMEETSRRAQFQAAASGSGDISTRPSATGGPRIRLVDRSAHNSDFVGFGGSYRSDGDGILSAAARQVRMPLFIIMDRGTQRDVVSILFCSFILSKFCHSLS